MFRVFDSLMWATHLFKNKWAKIADDAKSFEEEVCNKSKNSLSEKVDNFDQKNDSMLGEVEQLYEQNDQIEDVINNLDNQSEISKVSNEIIENISEKASDSVMLIYSWVRKYVSKLVEDRSTSSDTNIISDKILTSEFTEIFRK